MTLEAQINFYLSERYPKLMQVISHRGGEHYEKEISGCHYMHICWKRIFKNYHPRKFPHGTEIRKRAAELCRYSIEYRYSLCKEEEEANELRAAYKSVENAEPATREETEIPA